MRFSKIPQERLIIYGVLILFILLHSLLISKTLLYDVVGNMKTAVSGYGDIPFHLTQVTKFGYTSLFDLNEPIFTGTSIKYAFFINWISGFLFKIVGNLRFAFHFPAILFATGGTILTFLTYRKFLKKEWAAIIALLVFFLGSGFGAYSLIMDQWIGQSISFSEFSSYLVDNNISTVTRWNAEYPQQNIAWGAPLTLVLVHQRAFFLGFFLFTLFLYLLLRFQETKDKRLFYSLIAILGLSPLAHYHSFMVMGFTMVLFAVFNWYKEDRELFKKAVLILIFAAILSMPEVLYLVIGKENIISGQNSFIQPRLGWMTNPTIGSVKYPSDNPNIFETFISYMKFLWVNFGVILPLFAVAVFLGLKEKIKCKNLKFFILAGIMFFALVQLFKFQPWDYDNNKLLVYSQFFIAPVLVFFFIYLMKLREKLGAALLLVFFILAIHSGIVDIIPRYLVPTNKIPTIFNKGAIDMAEFIRENVPEDAQIITSSTHLNLVSSLAGRPVLVGYPGWLWTKGVDYGPRESDLKAFYTNPDDLDILRKYDVEYVLLDPMAIYEWKAQKNLFDTKFQKMYGKESLILYKVTGL
jgi:hypothetical protein